MDTGCRMLDIGCWGLDTGPVKYAALVFCEEFNGLKILDAGYMSNGETIAEAIMNGIEATNLTFYQKLLSPNL